MTGVEVQRALSDKVGKKSRRHGPDRAMSWFEAGFLGLCREYFPAFLTARYERGGQWPPVGIYFDILIVLTCRARVVEMHLRRSQYVARINRPYLHTVAVIRISSMNHSLYGPCNTIKYRIGFFVTRTSSRSWWCSLPRQLSLWRRFSSAQVSQQTPAHKTELVSLLTPKRVTAFGRTSSRALPLRISQAVTVCCWVFMQEYRTLWPWTQAVMTP